MGKLTASTYGATDGLVSEIDLSKSHKSGLDKYEGETDRLLDINSEPLSSNEKLAFAAGALVNALSTCTTGFYLNPFLLEVAQIPATLVSLMMFIGRGWDAVTTAVVGALVSKYPNLRRWLLIGAIPTSAAYMAIWIIIPGLSENQRAGWHFAMYLLFQLGTSAYHVPYTALTVRMHHDGKQRDAATTWRMLAEILSVLFGAGVQGIILALFNANDDSCNSCDDDAIDKDAENGYFYSAVVMTAVIVIGGIICPLGVKERVVVKPLADDEEKPSVCSSIKLALGNRAFVTLTGAFFFIWLTVQAVQGNILLYAKYSIPTWKNDFQYLLGALVFCATIGMPLWMVVMKKIGKKRSYIIGGTLLAPMLHILYWLPKDASIWTGLAICIAAGFALAACYLLPWAMLPSVVDDAELKTGRREEAIFYAFFVFFMKMGAGIALAGSAMALNIAGWEDPCCRATENFPICDCNNTASCDCGQPDGVGDALRLVIGIIGPILIALGVVLLFFFPITPEREEEIREEKAARMADVNVKRQSSRMSLADQGLTQNFIPIRSSDVDNASGIRKRRTMPPSMPKTSENLNPLTSNKRPQSLNVTSASLPPV
eukprot:TRINITY_DN16910_c0_g1_i1.p1 TRINITY_DN16910_c0_g1~~TRINITY_DN16910_c0_g1_i1.p1  ORF type:complete len:600 (+),score=127.70 TRINITY_DN16910_c0_g1_i1:95-1894(+)